MERYGEQEKTKKKVGGYTSKFNGIQNLVVAYVFIWKWILKNFLRSILNILYIVLKPKKVKSPRLKRCANWSWNKKSYGHLKVTR